jgi:predicted enzyme related to lactoylglutathione lyase
MASDAFLSWANRTVLRPDREAPYLSIQDIVVFVRNVDVSKPFYLEQLGFELLTEQRLPTGERWIEVAPPDGSANLALVEAKPDSPEYPLIGGYRWVLFMTEDVDAKYKEWSARGVHFVSGPETPGWGGTYARFEDPDGNAFGLEGFDEVRQTRTRTPCRTRTGNCERSAGAVVSAD